MVDLIKLKSLAEWHGKRSAIEASILKVAGPISKERVETQVKTLDERDFPRFTRKRINYFVDEWTRVTAWLFVPNLKEEMPAVLCCHSRAPEGKDEPAGIKGISPMAIARLFAERGYVTLAPDCITAGERVSSRCEPYESAAFYKDHPKMTLAGKMLADHMYGLDALADTGQVDTARLAVMGHGLGGMNALLLTAFDERVAACVASCGFTRMETDKNLGRWYDDGGLSLMPGLEQMSNEGLEFDWEHVIALAAPSAILVLTSLSDSAYVNPKSCQKAVTQASRIYKLLGASSALEHFGHHDGDTLSNASVELAEDWFDRWL